MGQLVIRQERRDFSRIGFRCQSILTVDGRAIVCNLRNISLRGALVQAAPTFRAVAGDPCVLAVHLDTQLASIKMNGTVAHSKSGAVGIVCQSLDLDSATHLRRLIEVNLGEDRLLDRELGSLLESHRM